MAIEVFGRLLTWACQTNHDTQPQLQTIRSNPIRPRCFKLHLLLFFIGPSQESGQTYFDKVHELRKRQPPAQFHPPLLSSFPFVQTHLHNLSTLTVGGNPLPVVHLLSRNSGCLLPARRISHDLLPQCELRTCARGRCAQRACWASERRGARIEVRRGVESMMFSDCDCVGRPRRSSCSLRGLARPFCSLELFRLFFKNVKIGNCPTASGRVYMCICHKRYLAGEESS